MYSIPRLPADSFDWLRWINNDIWIKLGVSCRYEDIKDQAEILQYYAVGYLEGEKLFCRPKKNETAVLFLINDEFGWTHLRNHEFERVFNVRENRILHTQRLQNKTTKRGLTNVALRTDSYGRM